MTDGLKNVFILAATSDIGRALTAYFADDGHSVIGTYRQETGHAGHHAHGNVRLLPCDVSSPESIESMVETYASSEVPWDIFVSCVGSLDPIGPFVSVEFDKWRRSIEVNALGPLRVLHDLYPHRRPEVVTHAVFFAGGGTNNPFTNYSAYCSSKIFLIKMCELLDDENPDLNAFIIGPGFLPTKIHEPTLANPEAAGVGYDRTRVFFDAGESLSYRDLYDCIDWCVAQGRAVVGGRNLSAVHDPWRINGPELAQALLNDTDRFKLRRSGNIGSRGATGSGEDGTT